MFCVQRMFICCKIFRVIVILFQMMSEVFQIIYYECRNYSTAIMVFSTEIMVFYLGPLTLTSFCEKCPLFCFRFNIGIDETRISVVRIGSETNPEDATLLSDSVNQAFVSSAISDLQVLFIFSVRSVDTSGCFNWTAFCYMT